MLYFIQGNLLLKKEKSIVVLVNNLGMEVYVQSTTIEKYLPEAIVALYTHFHVREDHLSLFGFLQETERTFFRDLISVSGVGPKLAMEIMEMPMEKIKSAIKDKNASFLAEIKGIGKKTAQKIVIELASKIEKEAFTYTEKSFYSEEIIFALQNLGFSRKNIFEKLQNLPEEIKATEEVIRWFLKEK